MIQILPAVLATTKEQYKAQINKIDSSHLLEGGWVHIDFMDNKFVANMSVGVETLSEYPTSKKIEAHLMVEDPYFWATKFKGIKITRFIAPIECSKDLLDQFISYVKANTDAELGFAFNPGSDIDKLEDYKETAQTVVLMSINPGKQGQQFMPEVLEKVKKTARLRLNNNLHFLIGVDGGINPVVVRDLIEAGADYLVVGSYLLEGDINENFEKIWKSI